MTEPAAFLWSESLRQGGYGRHHPLATPRVPLTHDLIRACGAFAPGELVEAPRATPDGLCAFHAPDYIEAYARAERLGRVDPEVRDAYRLGTLENPYFPRFFTIPATAAGASVRAAELLLEGRVAFNPAGGMHHARRAGARGFCFLNDAVLAILRLRQAGLRVLYVDIDAHHCDAVEAAFGDEPEVFTLSLHMDTSYAYPFAGGRFEDQGSAGSGHTQLNLPLPAGVHDAEYLYLLDAVLDRLTGRYRPQAVVLQAGADALMHDPLARLRLTTQGFVAVVQSVVDASPRAADGSLRLMAVGGGGYHPLATARAWLGVWAILSGRELVEAMPGEGARLLREVGWELGEGDMGFERLFLSRFDAPQHLPICDEIRALAAAVPSHRFFAAW